MNTRKNDPFLTSKIVRSYVRNHKLAANEMSDLITTVYRAISHLGRPPEPEEVRIPAVSVRRSVHQDYVICLDCGYRGKTLRRHISTRHGLSRDEYLRRWGLRSDHPLTAPAYSERRSTMAKALGLGRKSVTEVAVAPTPTTSTPVDVAGNPKARRTRRPRPTPRSEGAASETAARPTPARRRRSRAAVVTSPSD
jgi:predicted transcriptional regulator